jgi:Phospholipase_D-nuclease N-terminal
MLLVLLAIVWMLIWATIVVDIVRRRDLRASAKVLWALGVLVLPVIGAIVYLIARPADDAEPRFGAAGPPSSSGEFRERHPV